MKYEQRSPADHVWLGLFLKLKVSFRLFYNTWEQCCFSELTALSFTNLKCSELFNSNQTI